MGKGLSHGKWSCCDITASNQSVARIALYITGNLVRYMVHVRARIKNGQVIEVEFTCPYAVVNLPEYCEEHNHEVLEFDNQNNKVWKLTVKK